MFLKCNRGKKDGKEHRSWSVVESVRTSSGRIHQPQVRYLGEINDSQRNAWRKTIEVLKRNRRGNRQQEETGEETGNREETGRKPVTGNS